MGKPLLIAASIALAFSISACGRDDRAQQSNTGSGATANTGTANAPMKAGETAAGGAVGATGPGVAAGGGVGTADQAAGTAGASGTDAAAGMGSTTGTAGG